MKPSRRRIAYRLNQAMADVVLAAALADATMALAQTGGGYDVHWNVAAAGGGAMSGANGYAIDGTIAQVEVTPGGAMSGATNYALRGGFWVGIANLQSDVIFRSGFEAGL
jgi:hypothetical protein